jgi:hypothetical protein
LRYIKNRENRNGSDDDPNGKCVCFRSSFCRESSTHLRQLQLQFEGSSQGLQLGSLITLINTHFLHHQLLLLPSLAPLQLGRM